jgi:lipopolysaccharide export system permease protein
MLQNKIYQNYILEILKTFFTILLGLSAIAWTVRAVNFLDLIVDNGYPVVTYFFYSFLNLFGIMTKFFPLAFLISLTIFILRQIQDKELIILWTSGVKKIQIVNLFFLISLFITILYLIFSIFLTPIALNKSRMLLGDEQLTSFVPTIREQQFSDSFNGLTFVVDKKVDNQIKNIFLQDDSNLLKNLSSGKSTNNSNTIIAKRGLVENKSMLLFEGKIISSSTMDYENEIIKFDQLKIDLSNVSNTTIKKPKIQETSTLKLTGCIFNNIFNDKNCKEKLIKEIIPALNRRFILPFFIPVTALIACFMFISRKRNFFYNKVSIFLCSFFILLYAETIIRYTGLNKIILNIFLLSPLLFIFLTYLLIKIKLQNE